MVARLALKALFTAVAALLAISGSAVLSAYPGRSGHLLVSEKVVDEFGIYEEGAISYLRLRRVSDGEVVLRRRYFGERIRLAQELPARRYKLISFVRPCSGSCDELDPATDRCAAEFRVGPDSDVRARIVTNDGSPCRIRFPEP